MVLPLFHNVFFGGFSGQALETFTSVVTANTHVGDLLILGQSIGGVSPPDDPLVLMPAPAGFTSVITRQRTTLTGQELTENRFAVRVSVKIAEPIDIGASYPRRFSLAAMRGLSGVLQFIQVPVGTQSTIGLPRPVAAAYLAAREGLPFTATTVSDIPADVQALSADSDGFRSFYQLWGGDLAPKPAVLNSANSSVISEAWLIVTEDL